MHFSYKEKLSLIKELSLAELKDRNQDKILGWLWAFLYPLIMSAIMYFVFLNWTGKQVNNFAFYILVGIVHWNYFVSATSDSFNAILRRDGYLTKFSFPYELLVIASVIGSSLSYIVQMVLVTFFSYFLFGGWSCLVLLLPILMLMHILFVLGTSFALVSLHTYFRDMDYLWSILLRLTIFVTPVFYSIDMVGGKQKIFLLLNPMLYILNVARAIIVQKEFSTMRDMIIAVLISNMIFIVGIIMFRKSSKRFPELA